MKKLILIVTLLTVFNIGNSYARGKAWWGYVTSSYPCPALAYGWESNTDPCLKTYYCTGTDGKLHAMSCQSDTWDAAYPGTNALEAMEAGAIYHNSNISVGLEENTEAIFTASLNEDYLTSVEAASFSVPLIWRTNGWSYKIRYDEILNQITIKVFPLVYTRDTLICSMQNEDGGYSAIISIDSLEADLNGAPNRTLGGEKKFFSSDEIKISVYPNPAHKEFISIELKVPVTGFLFDHTVKIYDISGKLIIKKEFENLVNQISIKNFENGIYFVEVYDKKGVLLKKEKLIIQKVN